jgi:glycosyltransferase involved in cell wall biosynthesis
VTFGESSISAGRPGGDTAASARPLVSIVTIFLNAEKYLREAVDSVLAQSYPCWELLLIDDGSTDSSTAIATGYASLDRIQYLEHEGHQNRGMSASRNLGIWNARGAFIAFLDSDDVLLPNGLERLVTVAGADADIACGATRFWYGWTGDPEDAQKDWVANDATGRYDPPAMLTRMLLNEGIQPPPCSFVIRRELCLNIGGFEDDFRGLYEDTVFLAKAFLRGRVAVTTECVALYRQHSESSCYKAMMSGEWDPQGPNPARSRYLYWLRRYLQRQRISNPKPWVALYRALFPYQHPKLYECGRALVQAREHLSDRWNTLVRKLLRRPTGWIRLERLNVDEAGFGEACLRWSAPDAAELEVRVGSPNGPVLSHSGASGIGKWKQWFAEGTTFYLKDTTGTIARVRVRADPCRRAVGSPVEDRLPLPT